MRTLLLILTLTGLLAACSDNGDGQPDGAGAESAESTEQQDQKESGQDDSAKPGLEAGQPVTKPSPPEPQSSDEKEEASGEEAEEDSQDATEADPNKEDSGSGEVAAADIYDRYCVACHEQGMAGAPKLSNSSEWEKRIGERGFEGLVSNSWDGYRAMPAKGTCSDCSREELEATVKWMLDQAEVSF